MLAILKDHVMLTYTDWDAEDMEKYVCVHDACNLKRPCDAHLHRLRCWDGQVCVCVHAACGLADLHREGRLGQLLGGKGGGRLGGERERERERGEGRGRERVS